MTKLHTKTGDLVYIEVLPLDADGLPRFEVHHITFTGASSKFDNLNYESLTRTLNQLGVIRADLPKKGRGAGAKTNTKGA